MRCSTVRELLPRAIVAAWTGLCLGMVTPPVAAATPTPPLKIAFLYATPIGTAGWTYQHHMGRLGLEKNLGGAVQTRFVENVADDAEAERVLRDLATQGHRLIFATSEAHRAAVLRVAPEFPAVAFESMGDGRDVARVGVTNVSPYGVRIDQGRYLAGLIAGKMSRTGLVGHVAGVQNPVAVQALDAFTRGLRTANPKARVKAVWLDTAFNPAKEREAAERLVRDGADLLTQHLGSSAVAEVAEAHAAEGVRLLGDQSDLRPFAPTAQLTGSTLHWGDRYTAVAKAVIAGTWKPKPFSGGVRERVVRMAPYSNEVPRDVQRQVNEIERAMAAGRGPAR
jgi:simple sugar transport system substrate-binding protein